MAPGPHQQEREWQFTVDDLDAARTWLNDCTLPGFEVESRGTRQLRDAYYDTSDWRLHRAGYTLRVRSSGTEAEATLKSMAPAVDGLRQRTELTEHVPDSVGLEALPGPAGDIVRIAARKRPLQLLFVVETNRERFDLSDAEGSLGEIAIDSTQVRSAEGSVASAFSRIEVEVESLDRAEPFVLAFRDGCDLHPAPRSKFEEALTATAIIVTDGLADLGPAESHRDMTAAEYALGILRTHFKALVANEPGTRLGQDPEFLHDMRVASRRIRATMSAFDVHLPSGLRELRDEVKWLTGALGEVRDLDVQLERLQQWREAIAPLPAQSLDPIEDLLRTRRRLARETMLAELDSERYDRLVARFADALRAGASDSGPAGRVPVLEVAPLLVKRRYRRLRKHGDVLGKESPPGEYHRLRIEAKKLRYAAEFATPLYGKAARRFVRRLTRLQDLLGEHQDADVVTGTLLELAHTETALLPPDTLVAIGMLIERNHLHAHGLRQSFPAAYRKLRTRSWHRLARRFDEAGKRAHAKS
jgi:triphosphatase